MWLFTQEGFFSVVHKDCPEDQVCVRARVRGDLEKLSKVFVNDIAELISGEEYIGAVIDTPRGDYPCRLYVSRNVLAKYLEIAVMSMDYDNFKNTIPYEGVDGIRHDTYMDVWRVMVGFERRAKAQVKNKGMKRSK